MSYKLAVRKIMRSRRALKDLYLVSFLSFALAAVGFALYFIVYASDVILIEAFVWFIEGISFLGLAIAFHIASSWATMYRARFEILRLEALATLLAAITAIFIILWVIEKALQGGKGHTPLILSLYPLGSAVVSFVLERWLHKSMHAYEVKLASVRAVANKLGLDVVFEAAGGLSIIASNLMANPIAERLLVIVVGIYILYGLVQIAFEAVMYLVGIGPRSEIEKIRSIVSSMLEGHPRYRLRSLKVEMYGTFGEAEVWVEAPPDMSLAEASRESRSIARRLVHSIPELLRALVIMVPGNSKSLKLKRSREARRTGGRQQRVKYSRARRAGGQEKSPGKAGGPASSNRQS